MTAGIHGTERRRRVAWVPAFAGMTPEGIGRLAHETGGIAHAADLRLVPRLLRADRHQSHVHLRRFRPRPDDQGLLPDPRAGGRHHRPVHPGRRRRRVAAGLQARLDPPHRRRLHLVLPQHAAAGADLFLLFRAGLPAAPPARRFRRHDPHGLQRASGRSSRCRCLPAPSTSRSSAPASRPFRSRRWRRPPASGCRAGRSIG